MFLGWGHGDMDLGEGTLILLFFGLCYQLLFRQNLELWKLELGFHIGDTLSRGPVHRECVALAILSLAVLSDGWA